MTEIITLNTKSKVPDHLTESNIFCRYGKNDVVEVTPKELHFTGYKLNQINIKEIQFTNISDEISRFHIIPPVSKYFKLRYEKPARLVPGFYVKCQVLFTPDKVRNYNDFIKIHTKDSNNNVIVPLYAYPAIDGLSIPRNIKFPVTPVGHQCIKILQLHSDSDYDFDYEIIITKDNSCITLEPLSGSIPSHGNQLITLKFEPTDYATCEKTINIYVNQYNFKPITCTISGTSEPGLERKIIVEQYQMPDELLSLKKLEAKGRAAKSKMSLALSQSMRSKSSTVQPIEPHDEFKELKTEFENRVRENVNREKENQLKWQKYLGDLPISEDDVFVIKQQRKQAEHEYKLRKRERAEIEEVYLENYHTIKSTKPIQEMWRKKRTIRVDGEADESRSQIEYQLVPECWGLRSSVLDRFKGAVSRVIVWRRMEKRLHALLASGGEYIEIDTSHMKPGTDQLNFIRNRSLQIIDGDNCDWLSNENINSDNLIGSSTTNWNLALPEYDLEAPIKCEYRYWNLQVPLQMNVACYNRVDITNLSYHELTPIGLKMKSPAVAEKSAIVEQSEETSTSFYTSHTETFVELQKDKNFKISALKKGLYNIDEYVCQPLYYQPENDQLDQQKYPIGQNIIEWRQDKCGALISKKLMKSNTSNRFIRCPYDNSVVKDATVPEHMKLNDMKKLDYCDDDGAGDNKESISISMILEEFSFLHEIRSNLNEDFK